ncbi:MAG: YihY/virulence factor BrkB family protein [Phycisphaerales bacterium]|nr:YihY/virulence factor BrkB family protein [Phycisphaerales bacterium]
MKPIAKSIESAATSFAERRKSGLGSMLRSALRVVSNSQIARMAAALSYRTVFGLIPVLAIGVAVLGGFATPTQVKDTIENVLDFTGLKEIAVSSPSAAQSGKEQAGSTPIVGPFDFEDGPRAGQHEPTNPAKLEFWINNLVTKVREVSFLAIGITGSIMLIYAAMSFMVEIERSANHIYRAPTGRSWVRRITQYWTTLTLGSLFLIGTFYVSTWVSDGLKDFLATPQAQKQAQAINPDAGDPAAATSDVAKAGQNQAAGAAPTPGESAAAQAQPGRGVDEASKQAASEKAKVNIFALVAAKAVSAVTGFLLLLFLYMTIPNARVSVQCAAVGAAFAAVLWEAGKAAFVGVIAFSSYQRLYGVLALIPLFLLWVYITWIIILFGLQLSYVLQYFRAFSVTEEEAHGPILIDPLALVRVASIVARRFASGGTASVAHVASTVGLDERTSLLMLERLTDAGLVHRVPEGDETETFALARPAEQIQAVDLLRLASQMTDQTRQTGTDRLETLRRAQYEAAAGLTLAGLLPAASEPDSDAPGEESTDIHTKPDPIPAT